MHDRMRCFKGPAVSTKDLILERFPSLSPQLRTAAKFVVDHPNDVVIMSMRTLAERANVQPATLVRLAQQLGYAGWPELKDAFVADLGLHTERYGARAKNLSGRGRDTGLVEEMFAAHHGNLDATKAQIESPLRDAAKLLKRSRMVHVAGFRASYPVAYALAYGYRLFRSSVALIDGHAGGLEMQARGIERQDSVVAVSFAPYSRESMQIVEAAKAVGAQVIAFTDSQASPLALAADVSILFTVKSPSFFPSVTAAMAAAEALLEVLVAGAGDDIAAEIDRAEQNLFDSGAYLQQPAKRSPTAA
jgi:DNA-binding MurR/RpiR family transcriptional regulator